MITDMCEFEVEPVVNEGHATALVENGLAPSLLHKSVFEHSSALPGQILPMDPMMGMPRALAAFGTATEA